MNLHFPNHLLESAFAWTWKTSVQATVLIALVLLIQFAFAKILPPRWRYFLGLLILLRLVLPAAPASPLSIFNLGSHREPPVLAENLPATVDRSAAPIAFAASAAPLAAPIVTPAPLHMRIVSVRSVAAWLWLAGFAVMLAMVAQQHFNFVRELGRWERVREPRVLELLEHCRTMLGVRRNVIVLAATGLSTPALFGIVTPRLLLPVEMLERLDDRELRHVLLHELIHLKRGDLLVNWAMILTRAAHWFNPAVWLAFRRLRAEQELACDAAVMACLADDERRHYGRTLLKLLDDFSPGTLCPGLVPFITTKQLIKRRITMISNFKPAGRIATGASLVLFLALGPLTFTRAAEQTNATTAPSVAPLVVTIGKEGTFRVGAGQPAVDLEQLSQRMQEEIEKDPHRTLRIRADDATSINDLEDVINIAKKLKIASITFRDEGTSGVTGQKALTDSEVTRAAAEQANADARMELAQAHDEQARLVQEIESYKVQYSDAPHTNSLDNMNKLLDENIRLTEAKLNDLRNLKETYASDLAEHSSDQSHLVARLSDGIADAESQRAKQAALLNQLERISPDKLRQILPTTIPDAMLTTLMQDELEVELKLTEQRANMGANNPELVTTAKLSEKLNSQIDARVKGILSGLRTQVEAANASIESLQKEVDAQSKRQVELSDLASQITKAEIELQALQSQRSQASEELKPQQMK